MKSTMAVSAAALAVALWAGTAGASSIAIQYSLTNLGSDNYRYAYKVINDGSLPGNAAVQSFLIDFPGPGYTGVINSGYDDSSLSIVTGNPPAANWSEYIDGFVANLSPADYGADALAGGIASGHSQDGFAVQFHWFGPGLPGSQTFHIYDLAYNWLQDGETVPGEENPAPTPTPLALLGLGLGLIAALRRRQVSVMGTATRPGSHP